MSGVCLFVCLFAFLLTTIYIHALGDTPLICGGYTDTVDKDDIKHFETTPSPGWEFPIRRCYIARRNTGAWEKTYSLLGWDTSDLASVQWDEELIWLVGGMDGHDYGYESTNIKVNIYIILIRYPNLVMEIQCASPTSCQLRDYLKTAIR